MPSQEAVAKALELIRRGSSNYEYFFSKLNSVDWIEPLEQAGFFRTPPAAERLADTISFPFWPESQFLARIAQNAPELVGSIMLKMEQTDNMRVHEDLARAALSLPLSPASKWAHREAEWVEEQSSLYFFLPKALADLAVHLVNLGGLRQSVELIKSVLRKGFRPDTEFANDAWVYQKILKENYPAIVAKAGLSSIEVLIDLIKRSISDKKQNFSWIWRPAIEPHDQNRLRNDGRNSLVDALRDAVESVSCDGKLEAVLELLHRHNSQIFARIGLHILAEHARHPLAKSFALDRQKFSDTGLRHEYERLLKAVAPELSSHEIQEVLAWIDDGPPKPSSIDEGDTHTSRESKLRWQADRVQPLIGYLDTDSQSRYAEIFDEVGISQHPNFVSYSTSWVGPTSPLTEAELAEQTTGQIADFLRSWEPPRSLHSPDPEGLSRVLQSSVASNPGRFTNDLKLFENIDATYARAIVAGLEQAAKSKLLLDWFVILDYLLWIVAQPRELTFARTNFADRDPHWGWARRACASLLGVGVGDEVVPFELRQQVWDVLEIVANDPEPTDEQDDVSTIDAATQSINTTRGQAFHAVMRYALWVRNRLVSTATRADANVGLDEQPEVKRLLEMHLESEIDPSPAVRAVYGQWLPWLHLLDANWTEAVLGKIFSQDNKKLRDAAWDTYLNYCAAYTSVFRLLINEYQRAVRDLGAVDEGQQDLSESTGEHLGEHLLSMVGHGVISWHSDDELIQQFFTRASVQQALQSIAFVGRSLDSDGHKIPTQILERFQTFWVALRESLEASQQLENRVVLRAFGWWFACSQFDEDWATDQLCRAAELSMGIEPEYSVLERLADTAGRFPERALRVLRILLVGSKNHWTLLGAIEFVKAILSACLGNSATRSEAQSVIHEFGARGLFDFRDLNKP